VLPIQLGYNTVYLLDAGGERLLVDTGPNYRGAAEALEHALVGLQPAAVVATHGHLDHASLGSWWQHRGVPVWLGAGDLHLARRPPLTDPAEFREMTRFIESCGAPPEVQGTVLAGLEERRRALMRASAYRGYQPASDGRWPTALRYDTFEPDRLLDADGDLAGPDIGCLLLPGHTPGNLVVVDRSEGWLFSGDQLLRDIAPTPAIQARPPGAPGRWRFPSLPAYVRSLRRLAEFDFARCFPGHGEPFDDVARVIRLNLEQSEERTARVRAACQEAPDATLYGLCERLYPRAVRRRLWQIVSTVQGHLDLLEEAGERVPGSCSG
jgi:glyoxylase-like metal-dependent hydrolase (beta-lactamase superfamily II)